MDLPIYISNRRQGLKTLCVCLMKKKETDKSREQVIQAFLKGGSKGGETIKSTVNHLDDTYLDEFQPLEIKVFGYNFDRSFKAFRSLVQKDRILSLYKQKQSFEKPSMKRRRKKNEANQKRMELENRRQKILSGEFEKELIKKQKAKDLKRKLRENKQGS